MRKRALSEPILAVVSAQSELYGSTKWLLFLQKKKLTEMDTGWDVLFYESDQLMFVIVIQPNIS